MGQGGGGVPSMMGSAGGIVRLANEAINSAVGSTAADPSSDE